MIGRSTLIENSYKNKFYKHRWSKMFLISTSHFHDICEYTEHVSNIFHNEIVNTQ
jgi:hypothetical protein